MSKWTVVGGGGYTGATPGGGSVSATGALTADQPVFGDGTVNVKVGTKSGNTNKLATVSGSFTSGNFIKSDASGNVVDAGVAVAGVTATVATIAALRLLAVPSAATSVILQGYYAAQDGGGGVFTWDTASTAADNAGTVILPTAYIGTGRWRRQYEGPLFVRWFGAKGDGTTDDSTAISAAITEAAAHWSEVTFDGSTYSCTGLSLTTAQMKLVGQNGTILKNRTAGSALLVVHSDLNTFEGIDFHGNFGIGGTTANVVVFSARNIFTRCRSYSSTDQGWAFDGQSTTCNFNVLDTCEALNNHSIGASFNTAPDNRLIDSYFHGNGAEGWTFDVVSHRCQAIGCHNDANCTIGGVGNVGVDDSNDCLISGCIITGAPGALAGIKTQNNIGASSRLTVTGCSITTNGGPGVWLFAGSAGNTSNCTITGNSFSGNGTAPIKVDAGCSANMIAGNALNGGAIVDAGTGTVIIQSSSSGGSVTSVALSMPTEFSVTGSPITGAGTLAVTKAVQSANTVFRGPTSGVAAVPVFGALVAADIPAIPESGVTGLVVDLAAKALAVRAIATTAPLTGGGDLSADRTFAISDFGGDSGTGGSKGAVPAPAAGDAAAQKFLAAGGGWSVPAGSGGSTHSESLTDGSSNFIFAGGDIVTVVGVPN